MREPRAVADAQAHPVFAQQVLSISTPGQGFTNISRQVSAVVRDTDVDMGLCSVFVQHTSASLVIQENADPAVLRDLARWMSRLTPEGGDYEHADEGPDDMPAHLRSAITRTAETIPIRTGRLCLGTWQGIYLWEHRARAHRRSVVVTVSGTRAS